VVVIQHVVIRWSAAGRGAAAANVRRSIPDALPLPSLPDAPIVLHDVLAWDALGYAPKSIVTADAAAVREAGLWIEMAGDEVVEVKLVPPTSAPPSDLTTMFGTPDL